MKENLKNELKNAIKAAYEMCLKCKTWLYVVDFVLTEG